MGSQNPPRYDATQNGGLLPSGTSIVDLGLLRAITAIASASSRDAAHTRQRLAAAEAQLAGIEASTCWRLTRPVRTAAIAWRRLAQSLRAGSLKQVHATPAPLPLSADATAAEAGLEATRERYRRDAAADLDAFLSTESRLCFAAPATPRVSVLLVLHNQAELTLRCLVSLLRHAPAATEIVILDNASTDRTDALLDRVDGARVIRSTDNLHYLRGVNRAATVARGDWLLLLNNDTMVEPGAIDAAARRLEEEADLGAVGGPILRTDGLLQEAGCIIWRDAHSEGYGLGQDPAAPEYAFRRDVDYCSGAFLMVRRNLFAALGGLDEAYAPAYYEEADLCMRMREAGYRVAYEPAARILHIQYGSIGSHDRARPLYLRNREIFARRHRARLQAAHHTPGKGVLAARARTGTVGAVLLLTTRRSQALAAWTREILVLLRAAQVPVTHVCLLEDGADRAKPGDAGIERLCCARIADLEAHLRARAGYYSLVFTDGQPDDDAALSRCVAACLPGVACVNLADAVDLAHDVDAALAG